MSKTAVVFGVTGQDGSYLSELLLEKDYIVYGVKRRSSTNTLWRLEQILDNNNFDLVEGELTDYSSVSGIIGKIKPDEIYNLGAMSQVHTSFAQPSYTFNVNANGPLYILESVRTLSPNSKVYQASTSELMASNYDIDEQGNKYQDENTKLSANSPYAVAKLAAHNLISLYRRSYNIFACSGILYNHEGKRRGEDFVTRKITRWIGQYKNYEKAIFEQCQLSQIENAYHVQHNNPERLFKGILDDEGFPKLRLGNLNSFRDFGHAKDYVKAQWLMLQQDKPDDFIIATGETHTIEDFLKLAFEYANLGDYKNYIVIDPQFYRPCEVEYLRGKADKARKVLGWEPTISFEELVKEMVDADIELAIR